MNLHTYKYIAKTKENKTKKGSIEAPSQELALQLLQYRNLSVRELTKHDTIFTKLNNLSVGQIISRPKLIFMLHQLGALLEADINLLTALELLAIQEQNRHLRRMYFFLYKLVYEGKSLSSAMEQFPQDFPFILIRMVEATNLTGDLGNTMLEMGDYFAKEQELSKKIRGTYFTPLVYLILTAMVTTGLMVFVFPSIEELFVSFDNAKLPTITLFFMILSDFFQAYWVWMLSIIVGLIVSMMIGFKYVTRFQRILIKFGLNMPIFGRVARLRNQVLISNMLSEMLSHGVKPLQALEATEKIIYNIVYKEIIHETIEDIYNGYPLSKVFFESSYIDPIFSRIMEIGEETGELPRLMHNITGYYEQLVLDMVAKIKGTLQPILMIVIYAIVGSLFMAMMLPMITLGTQI